MSGMIRKLMRGMRRGSGTRMQSAPVSGSERAVMKSRRGVLTESEKPSPAAVELPAEIEKEIPPLEDEDDAIAAEIAEGEAEIAAEDAAAEAEEALEEAASVEGSEPAEFFFDPVTGGVDCEPRVVVYDPGDGIPRAIPDPLGILPL